MRTERKGRLRGEKKVVSSISQKMGKKRAKKKEKRVQ